MENQREVSVSLLVMIVIPSGVEVKEGCANERKKQSEDEAQSKGSTHRVHSREGSFVCQLDELWNLDRVCGLPG